LWTPVQEIRIEKHKKKIEEYNIIVLNAWWTIDYITWFEQRAPDRVVKARVLETFWRICAHPKKNIKKFLAMFGIVRYRWYWFKKKLLATIK
jgi:UDP-N-acetyl-D-mannosaminuronic acid transferase (WecB/TagA/CpsF family)